MSQIVKSVQKAVKQSALSRYQICKATRIDQGHLSRFMTGEKGLSFDALERLADHIGLEIIIRKRKKGR